MANSQGTRLADEPKDLIEVIQNAIDKKQRGNEIHYQAVIENISACGGDEESLLLWVKCLQSCTHILSKEMDVLVGTVLRIPWNVKGKELAEEYIKLMRSLVSAQTFYTKSCILMVVKHFVPRVKDGGSEESDKSQSTAYLYSHACLKRILHTVPTAPKFLLHSLHSSVPYKGKPPEVQEVFFRNLLYIAEYLPSLNMELLELMVDHMMKLDVDLPWLNDVVDPDNEQVEMGVVKRDDPVFAMDVDLPSDLDERVVPTPWSEQHSPPVLHAVYSEPAVMENTTADKLDILMTVCFEYLHKSAHVKGQLDISSSRVIFTNLLKVFDKIVLTTIGSTHVQFLYFYFCSFSSDFVKEFLDFLWHKFTDVTSPAIYRISAMVYMTSFVARAKYVSLRIAKECLSVVMEWIHQYIDGVSEDQLKPDIRVHSPFYTACQGVFYVLIFRHQQFENVPWGMEFLRKLNFDRLISTRLNPLKLCLPSVVEKFAQVTKQMELVFCYSIMEHNKRILVDMTDTSQIPEAKKLKAHLSVNSLLDCFFPFDPYCLKRSHKFIHGHYVEWAEEEESSSESEEMEDKSGKTDPFLQPSPGFYGSLSPP